MRSQSGDLKASSLSHGLQPNGLFQVKFQKEVLTHETTNLQENMPFPPNSPIMAKNVCCWQPGTFQRSSLLVEFAPSGGSAETEFGKFCKALCRMHLFSQPFN